MRSHDDDLTRFEADGAPATASSSSTAVATAMVLASHAPARVAGVLFFGYFMDPGGAKEFRADELRQIRVPITIVHSEHDESIEHEHAEYLAQTIPGAELVILPGVSHFAPLQRPEVFDEVMLRFARRVT